MPSLLGPIPWVGHRPSSIAPLATFPLTILPIANGMELVPSGIGIRVEVYCPAGATDSVSWPSTLSGTFFTFSCKDGYYSALPCSSVLCVQYGGSANWATLPSCQGYCFYHISIVGRSLKIGTVFHCSRLPRRPDGWFILGHDKTKLQCHRTMSLCLLLSFEPAALLQPQWHLGGNRE